MPCMPCREVLPRALAHTLEHCLGKGGSMDGPASCALDPGHSIVIMPGGGVYALDCERCPELRPGRGAGAAPVALPEISGELASRSLRSLLGRDAACGLALAFCASAANPANPVQVAMDLACGGEPEVAHNGWPLFQSDFEVSRNDLDPYNPAAFVNRVMDGAWEAEERLCRREISELPEHEITPGMAGLIARGDMVGLLRHMCVDMGHDDLDTVIVNASEMRKICEACPGLSPSGTFPCLWQDGEHAVLAHDHVSGYIAVRPSLCGPELAYGPVVMRCGDHEFSISHYCEVVYPPASRQWDAAGGFRVVLDPSLGRLP